MGQSWNIFNLTVGQVWRGRGHDDEKLGSWIWSSEFGKFAELLTSPLCVSEGYPRVLAGWSAEGKKPKNSLAMSKSKLLQLPVELINMIFDNLNILQTMIYLCLVHEYLGAVGERHVYDISIQLMAPWAGHRIICVGDYARDNDYPSAVRPYVQGWRHEKGTAQAKDTSLDSDSEQYESGFYSHMRWTYRRVYDKDDVPFIVKSKIIHPIKNELTPADEAKCTALLAGLRAMDKYPTTRSSVLANLSKREFVRGNAVDDLDKRRQPSELPMGWKHNGISLAQAMLSQICWSSDHSCALGTDCDRLTRGPWAGDRFEITTHEVLMQNKDVEWRDVSDEVCKWLEKLWADSW